MWRKILYALLGIILVLIIAFFAGPRAAKPELDPTLPTIDIGFDELAQWVHDKEFSHPSLKENNEARIIWADSIPQITEYSLVFIPGFSASYGEGLPIHEEFAQRYGCNFYASRPYGHGLDTADAMIDLTPDNYLASAKEAIAIGKKIGKKVIVMSSSTGGTMGLYLAAYHPEICALICYSPNIKIYDPNAELLTGPWGLQLAKTISGSDFREYEPPEEFPEYSKYWTTKYRIESLIALQSLVEHSMKPEIFEKVNQPLFMGYYYESEEKQDMVVSVKAMMEMYNQISTPVDKKRKMAFPEANRHVICSRHATRDYSKVREETFKFAEEVLGLKN